MAAGKEREDDQRLVSSSASGMFAATVESPRRGRDEPPAAPAKTEERLSLFWRAFGGTLLSIGALVAITLYQEFAGTVNELRADVNTLHETRGDFVKAEDCNSRMTALWGALKDMEATSATMPALKERLVIMEDLVKQNEQELKTLLEDLQRIRERLAVVEARQGSQPPSSRQGNPAP